MKETILPEFIGKGQMPPIEPILTVWEEIVDEDGKSTFVKKEELSFKIENAKEVFRVGGDRNNARNPRP